MLTAWSASVVLSWDPNSEPDLAGYKVYYGSGSITMVDVGNQTTATLPDLLEGLTYTIYATAYNTAGLESAPSEAITYTVPSTVEAPRIVSHPSGFTLVPGDSLRMAVTASGTGPLQYQWQKDGQDLAGATGESLLISAVQLLDAGSYRVRVSNSAGSTLSDTAVVTVSPLAIAPTIVSGPASQVVSAGADVNLSVFVTGTAPLTYQWFKNGAVLSGATTATLSILGVQAVDAGEYYARVSNSAGSVESQAALLTVVTPPVITSRPISQSIPAGQSVTFSVSASGTGPLSYQWRKNGVNISGATSASYQISSVQSGDAGSFTVHVTNPAGEVESQAAVLTVLTGPVITAHPVSLNAEIGQAVTFSVTATGTGPLEYQWLKNGAALTGANSSSYTIASIRNSDAGSYTVRVSNSAGSSTSLAAVLSVNEAPVITQHPQKQRVNAGEAGIFTVEATGAGLEYQWLKDGELFAGETGASLIIPAVQADDAGAYAVRVSNGSGTVLSSTATLTVVTRPRITSNPVGGKVKKGQRTTLAVEAEGTGPLEYQWYLNGASISGETDSTLVIDPVETDDVGAYSVWVSNSAGAASSEPAMLVVEVEPPVITQELETQRVNSGESFSLSVEVSGSGPFQYEWFKNGQPITGAGSAVYSVDSAVGKDAAIYLVEVSNEAGSVSSQASISVVSAPVILEQPASQTVATGGTVTVLVSVIGSGPLTYEWSRNEQVLPSGTNSSFTISSAVAGDSGNYSLRISNSAGAVVSDSATITVLGPPQITEQPVGGSVALDGNIRLSVSAAGEPPISYQWLKDGAAIEGAVDSTLTISSANKSDGGEYQARVSSPGGSTTSAIATVQVILPPVIVTDLEGHGALVGESVSFTLEATGTGPLNYEWSLDGNVLAGVTGPTLTISPVELAHAGVYRVKVSNSAGTVEGAATLVVNEAPSALTLSNEGGALTLAGHGTPGKVYEVQACSDLAVGYWVTVQTITVDGSGVISVEITEGTDQPMQFYRTVLLED